MSGIDFTIHRNGSIDLSAGSITVTGIVPRVNEAPLCHMAVCRESDSVRYDTENGSVSVVAGRAGDTLALRLSAEGFAGIHDIEPIGAATIEGADNVYVQGFGMEGPSGYFAIDEKKRISHGIVGISNADTAMVFFTTDHRKYNCRFSVSESSGLFSEGKNRTFLSAGFDLEGTAGDHPDLPELHVISGSDIMECMTRAAKLIAEEMGARTNAEAAFHWCSWYYHYENLSQSYIDRFMKELSEDRVDFRYIQIDAGYVDHMGDWKKTNHRYPGGLEKAAASILDAGYEAGIWIAPFMVGDKSELFREHPDWIVREKDGSPHVVFRSYTEPKIWGNTDNDYYSLDTTNPGAFAWLRDVFASLRECGFTLYKTDFLLWSIADSSKVMRYDNSKTSVEVLRESLAMIREVIGEESYLLGSIAPFMPCIGYVDGMRIASDMGAQWTEGAFGPANLLQELPYDNYFNNIYWQNDPDSVILRQFATHLTETETRSIALLQALSGGIITTSDPISELSEDRRKLLDFIRPGSRVHAQMPFLTEGRDEIVITHNLPDWNLLYILNPTSQPLKVSYRLDELFGGRAIFQYRFNWNDDKILSEKCSCFSDSLAPHESVLLFITEEPMNVKPSNLWGLDAS